MIILKVDTQINLQHL